MSGDDRRKLGKINLERKFVTRRDAAPPSSELRAKADPTPPAAPPAPPVPMHAVAPESGVATTDLAQVVIAMDHLALVPRAAAEALAILPLMVREEVVIVAMANAQDRRAVDEVEFATGKAVSPRTVARDELMTTIAAAYDAAERGELQYRGPKAPAPAVLRSRRHK